MSDFFAVFLNIKYTSTTIYQNTIIYNGVIFNNIIYDTCILDIIPNRLILKLWLKQPTHEQYNSPNLTYSIENTIQFEHSFNQQFLQNILREKLKEEQLKQEQLKQEQLKQEQLKQEQLEQEQLKQYKTEREKLRNQFKYLAQEYVNPIEDYMYHIHQIHSKDKIIPEIVFEITGYVSINFKLNNSVLVYKLYISSQRSYLNFRKNGSDSPAHIVLINKIKTQLKIFYDMTMKHIELTKKINEIKNSLEKIL